MELTRVPIAASLSLHGVESGTGDVYIEGNPTPRHGVNPSPENRPPDAGGSDGTSSSKSSQEAFVRHTSSKYPNFIGSTAGATTNDEGSDAASEKSPSYDKQETAPDEQRENEGGGFQDPAVFSSEGIEVRRLARTDRQVRSHEQAHIAAGGQYVVSGASFSYQRGPDGRLYAVGGEVSIDTSEIPGDPEATIRKMQQIRSAALAPSDPSSQDRTVATRASRIEARARQEALYLRMEKREHDLGKEPGGTSVRSPENAAGAPLSGGEIRQEAKNPPELDLYV